MLYDAFLSHSSADKPFVTALEAWLRKHGVRCFLDKNDLLPGDVLTDKLGHAMDASRAAIICIGPNGEGPWQKEEVDSLLNRSIRLSRTKNEFRQIPVLLPKADTSQLRWFLQSRLWCDLSRGINDGDAELHRLRAAILGERDSHPPALSVENPYRGLEIFGREHSEFFFGRTAESKLLTENLRDWHFACVVGPSGNGKSSLVYAGLASAAAEAACPGITGWRRLMAKPGGDWLRALLVRLYESVPDTARSAQVNEALNRILGVPDEKGQRPPVSPDRAASKILEELETFHSDGRHVLVILDQFEEIFTHRGAESSSAVDPEAGIRFQLAMLAAVVSARRGRWHFALTLRSDFEARCQKSDAFWALLSKGHLRIGLEELNEDGWREAIKGPAARAGAYLEAGLVETMLKDVFRQRGSMPLLQTALQELWQDRDGACLTHAAYRTIGGVANALQNRAENTLRRLRTEDPLYAEIARNLFIRLTVPGEGVSDTRRRAPTSELALGTINPRFTGLGWVGIDERKVGHVISELSSDKNRLIVADAEAVEITHEVLIRDCETIRGWIEKARGEIGLLRRLTYAARKWEAAQRDPDLLKPPDPLADLKKWAGQTSLWLTNPEADFLVECRRAEAVNLLDQRRQTKDLRAEQEKRHADAKAAAAKQRKLSRLAWSAAVAMLLGALLAGWQWWRASVALEAVETAWTKNFVRSIGVTDPNKPLTSAETEALWELAELGRENNEVRNRVLKQWFTSPDEVAAPMRRNGFGLNAALGLSPRQLKASIIAEVIIRFLEDGSHETYLAEALGAVAKLLTKDQFEPLTLRAASVLVTALGTGHDSPNLRGVAESLAEVAKLLTKEQAKPLAVRLAAQLKVIPKESSYRLCFTAQGFVGVAKLLPKEQAEPLALSAATVLLTAVEEMDGAKLSEGSHLVESLMEVAKLLTKEQAHPLALKAATVLVAALEKTQEDDLARLFDLSTNFSGNLVRSLSEVAKLLTKKQAEPLAVSAATVLVTALEMSQKDDNSDRPGSESRKSTGNLAKSLAEVTKLLTKEKAEPFGLRAATVLVTALEMSSRGDPYGKFGLAESLAEGLAEIANLLTKEQAEVLALRLVMELKRTPGVLSFRWPSLARSFIEVAKLLTREQAELLALDAATGLAKRLDLPRDSYSLRNVARSLAEVAKLLPKEQAETFGLRVATVLMAALEKAHVDYPLELRNRLAGDPSENVTET